MARSIHNLGTGSAFTTAASVPRTVGAMVYVGFTATLPASGSAAFLYGTASGGSPMLFITTPSSLGTYGPVGPFSTPAGVFCASISGGSAFAWPA